MNKAHYRIEDWMEVRRILRQPLPKMYSYKSYKPASSYLRGSKSWDLGCGWEGALAMAQDAGWPEGAANIKSLADKYIDSLSKSVYVKQYVYDVQGLSFDVGMLMQGEPEHWIRTEDTDEIDRKHGKLYSIMINTAASSSMNADVIMRRGAAAASIVSLLESVGMSTSLDVTNQVIGQKATHTLRIDISLKKHGEPLDMDRLALIAVHPAGLRRIMFKIKETITTEEERKAIVIYCKPKSYGTPTDIPETELADVDIYSPALVRSRAHPFGSDSSTEEWIKSQLQKLGVVGE